MSVVVYVLTADPNSKKAQRAASLFDDRMFNVQIATIKAPTDIKPSASLKTADKLEIHRVMWCLKDAHDKYNGIPVIILKDTTVSVANSHTIASVVCELLNEENWDIYYLCRWLDNCKEYSDYHDLTSVTIQTAKTRSPHGFQAVMFRPFGRDCLLGKRTLRNGHKIKEHRKPLGDCLLESIAGDGLHARTFCNNLLTYDMTHARENRQFLRLDECVITKHENVENKNGDDGFSVWWFILIVLAVIILVWLLWYFGYGGENREDYDHGDGHHM